MPPQLNDPTVHFWHTLAYQISDHQTKREGWSELHISLSSQKCTLHRWARKLSSPWHALLPLYSMAPPHPPPPLRYIVDCLHIWPLPRGRIHFGWHRCILTDWSFWFGSRGNSLHFSFIVNLSLVWSKIHQWKRSNICDCKYLVFAGWLDLNSWSWGEVAI